MNFILTLIIGIVAVLAIHQLKILTQKTQGSVFSAIIYAEEIILCLAQHTSRIYSKNAVLSVVIMLIFPFIILFAYYAISGVIKNEKANK